jgi:hypothetical protein
VLTERLATTVAALLVSTAAISSGVAASSPAQPVPEHTSVKHDIRVLESSVLSAVEKRPRKEDKKPSSVPVPVAEPVTPEEAPAGEEPQPVSSPADDVPQEDEGPNESTPEPTYVPVAPAVGWERGAPIPATAPTINDMRFDCGKKLFAQHLETVIQYDDESLPAVLEISVDTTATIHLTVSRYEQEVVYGGGAPQVLVSGSGRDTVWTMSGSYSSDAAKDPREVGLPLYGRFSLRIAFDCIAPAVKTEHLGLTAD